MSLTPRDSQRLLFKPARSSRHRVACLALYRALVRAGARIPLPDDLGDRGPINPIQHAIRRQFERNRHDVSKRLVFSALAAGYKFLHVFVRAWDPASEEHFAVTQHLYGRGVEAAVSRLNRRFPTLARLPSHVDPPVVEPGPPSPGLVAKQQGMEHGEEVGDEGEGEGGKEEGGQEEAGEEEEVVGGPSGDQGAADVKKTGGNPVLVLLRPAGPGTPPVYYRAQPMRRMEELKSRRHVPQLVVTSMGVPFLRFGKPQPVSIDRFVRARHARRHRFADQILSLENELAEAADHEDIWEDHVDCFLDAWGGAGRDPPGGPTYGDSIRLALLHVQRVWNEDTQDLAAQAHAMFAIAEEETKARDREDSLGWYYPETEVARNRKGRKIGPGSAGGAAGGGETAKPDVPPRVRLERETGPPVAARDAWGRMLRAGTGNTEQRTSSDD